MTQPGKILLVEDDPHDVELTLTALTENHLTNEIVVVRDGATRFARIPIVARRRGATAHGDPGGGGRARR